ncbi:MAG: DUF2828 family protein [Sarcina sp.]
MLLNSMKKELALGTTTNGAVSYTTSLDSVVDFFATAGAMRQTPLESKIKMFGKAYLEDRELALKTLFYIRDARQGQGERETFRQLFAWLQSHDEATCIANMFNIIEFGRYDDLLEIALYCDGSRFKSEAISLVKKQIMLDLDAIRNEGNPSLLGKWMWSENTSSKETRRKAAWLRTNLGMTERNYRKLLTRLRKAIGIVESKMSEKKFEEINYSHVPSLAMTKYRTAFYRNDEDRMTAFIDSVSKGEAKINASVLYPYDIVRPMLNSYRDDNKAIAVLEEQWKALPNYMGDNHWNGLVVADVSGSMSGLPMEVAISLAIYIAQRNNGYFKDHFMTFSEKPSLETLKGDTLLKTVRNLSRANWGMSTNLVSTFDLILKSAIKNNLTQADLPSQLIVITDMQFDSGCRTRSTETLMESVKREWSEKGYEVPKLVWWNVNASRYESRFPMTIDEAGVQYVSGCSPVILKTLMKGEFLSPIEVVKETVCSERYSSVIIAN